MALVVLVVGACAGCPTRKETITVAPDGAVAFALEYEATAAEFERFDALPNEQGGWRVNWTVKEQRDDGESTKLLTAKREFVAGEQLPRNFADPDDANPPLVLDFPTTVKVERRQDGVYYYFTRTYTPRRWAHIQFSVDVLMESLKETMDKPTDELSTKERGLIVQGLAGIETFKQLEFAKDALAESAPDLPVEHRLLARQALFDVYQEDYVYFLTAFDLCDDLGEKDQDKCFDREAGRILSEGYTAFVASLRTSAGFTALDVADFENAYERTQRAYRYTEVLGGHHFEIEVELPGTIIAHNGNDVREAEDGGNERIVWQFEGKAIFDRSLELLAVSRVDN